MKTALSLLLVITFNVLRAQNLPESNVACLIATHKQANLDSLAYYNQHISAGDKDLWYYYARRGAAYYHLGFLDKAIENCDSAIALNPDSIYPYETKLSIYYQSKDADAAKKVANAALKRNNKSSEAWLIASTAFEMLADRNKQKTAIDKALEYEPGNALALCYLGIWHARKGKSLLGLSYVNESIATDSTNPYYYYVRATILRDLKQWTSALSDADQAMSIESCYTEIQFTKAEIYQLKRDYDLAIQWFTTFINANPPYARAYAKRGYCYEQQKNSEKAVADFLRAAHMGDADAVNILQREYPEEYAKFMRN